MCDNYSDTNRTCIKYSYRHLNIEKLFDNLSVFRLLSFMDAYSGYNLIPMNTLDRYKSSFMNDGVKIYYKFMPFVPY